MISDFFGLMEATIDEKFNFSEHCKSLDRSYESYDYSYIR